MSMESHDFKKPQRLASEEEERLLEWMKGSASSLDEMIDRYFPIEFRMRTVVEAIDTARWNVLFPTLDNTCIGFRVAFVREERDTLMIMKRPFAKLVIDAMLGDNPTKLPEDGELSPASSNVLKFFIDYLVRSIRENWPGGEPGHIQLRQEEPTLKRQRVIQPEESAIVVRYQFKGPFGNEPWLWVIPYEIVLGLFQSFEDEQRITQTKGERHLLEGLVSDMPARVTVRLGMIELNSLQLKALQPGDVLVLDQKVNAPLNVTVADECAFVGWPGRVGSRQALQIESMVKG